jgi:4-hydroxy-2-oxoheptanedioate aldolase
MNMAGMIKIEQTQYTHQAMRAIGAGFQSVLFADIRSVEDARLAVDAVRAETTMVRGARGRGRLGVGMRRDVGTVRQGGTPAYVDALNEVVIAIMVEKKSCVDDLDAILSVPGIDMVQFGASDFSMSIGKTGQYGDSEVLAAETKTIQTALKKGLHPRVELRDPSQAGRYLEMGVKHFCIGWDVRILADWWDTKGAEMRKLLRAKPKKAAGKQAPTPTRAKSKANGRAAARGNYA